MGIFSGFSPLRCLKLALLLSLIHAFEVVFVKVTLPRVLELYLVVVTFLFPLGLQLNASGLPWIITGG